MNSELKLLSCPFCGENPAVYEITDGWYVDCNNDDSCNFVPQQQNGIHRKQDAIDKWNIRFYKGDKQQ